MNARKSSPLPWHITGEFIKALIITGAYKRVNAIVEAFEDLKENDRLDDAAIGIIEDLRTGNSAIEEAPNVIVVVDGVRNAQVYISRDTVVEMTRKAADELGLNPDSPIVDIVDLIVAKMFSESVAEKAPKRLDISVNDLIDNQIAA